MPNDLCPALPVQCGRCLDHVLMQLTLYAWPIRVNFSRFRLLSVRLDRMLDMGGQGRRAHCSVPGAP